MSSYKTLRHAVITALLLLAFLGQGTWALAGTTGNIAGTVKDATGAPIAGAQVDAIAPSMSRTATTDAGGHFVLLSLAPDTYTINLTRGGYQSVSFPGVTVFADQTQEVAYTLVKTLKTIARVTSTAGASLVKSGVGGDLYSVNAAQASAAQALGGGGNLNNAYSAMASVPGIQTSLGGMGWISNGAEVRGANYYQTAFEYDGIPVNRAFDNYNSSTESSLGLQELQVYTGGGPASVASAGTAGFINQVIKTGTFPGYGDANLGVATPTFYHQAQVEIGGSTPDRTFSYYVGLSGYNQDFRFIDNNNAAAYGIPGGIYSGPATGNAIGYGFFSDQVIAVGPTCFTIGSCQGVKPTCSLYGTAWKSPPAQGCWEYYNGTNAGSIAQIADRESVINLHMGIPKRNGLRDDVQVLWSGSALWQYGNQSLNDLGPGNNQLIYALNNTIAKAPTCGPETVGPGLIVNGCSSLGQIVSLAPLGIICGKSPPSDPFLGCASTYIGYADNVAYDAPFGTVVARNGQPVKAPGVYMAPGTPAHAFDGPLPLNDQSINNTQNDTGIAKVQYTYALSQAAYLRLYGYTFYSNWFNTYPSYGATAGYTPSLYAADYLLDSHTAGGALDFQDQINDQNLLALGGNYITSNTTRWNNTSAYGATQPIGYMSSKNGKFTCYDPSSGNPLACISSAYYDVASKGNVSPTWVATASGGPDGFAPGGSPAAKAGATWDSLWTGNATGSLNNVGPRFSNASLSDQFRPSDRFLINASVRYDNFTYNLPDSETAATEFYATMFANYTCVYKATNQLLTQPLPPGAPPPAPAQYVNGDCDAAATALAPNGPHTGWVHPNGTTQDGIAAPNFTAASPSAYSQSFYSPRVSATYTFNTDTVVRASAGRFVQPPLSASVQYLSASGDERSVWTPSVPLGFYSPFHPIPAISAAQYDASIEHHFRGTDMSFKLTPFYTWTPNWQQQSFIGPGFVTQVPVGISRNEGAEFQFNKGDFTRNGFSGQLAVTYTSAKIQFANYGFSTGGFVPNQTTSLNQAIAQYNKLTKQGGGSPCYQITTLGQEGVGVPCSTKSGSVGDTIENPYYNQPEQGLLNPGGWYNPYTTQIAPNLAGSITSYISPWTSSLLLNYRKDKLSITPSIGFQTGGFYGSPLDINGLDPRACLKNSASTGITKLSPKTNPLQCNYLTAVAPGYGTFGYFWIPNPQTGTFAFDNYQNPSLIVGNLQVSYDLSPKIKLTVLGANLFHACFGGSSTPWSAANPPGYAVCGYSPAGGSLNSSVYPSNFYNGTGINDFKANGARTPVAYQQSYTPSTSINGANGGFPPPLNVYFNAAVKI